MFLEEGGENRFQGHFCVTDSLTDSQTHKLTHRLTDSQTDGKCVAAKKKSKKSSKVEIFTMVKIQNIYRGSYKKSLLDIFSTSCEKQTNKLTNQLTDSKTQVADFQSGDLKNKRTKTKNRRKKNKK